MSFLDLYQGDQDQAAKMQPNEGSRLPSTFKENFDAAWRDGLLFSQSVARDNARAGVLNDYVSEIKQKTGRDLGNELMPDIAGPTQGVTNFDQANASVAKLKESYPELDLNPLSEDEIDKRAIAKSQAAHKTYQTLQAGEKTWGGSFGSQAGSLAAGAADPINIVGMAVAPEAAGIGILSSALRWGALAGVSQAAIEFQSDQFKEQVQPGYTESGEPLANIAGAAVGGAVVGGGMKALGNAWTRVKTGQWPTSVRDAGNVIESEAHTASTNPFPGAEGEVAHREALSKATDDILGGRPVDVSQMITPDLLERSRGLIEKLQTEQPMSLPVINRRAIELAADHERLTARDTELAANIEKMPPGDASAADRLNRLQAVDQNIADATDPAALRKLNERKDQILVDTNPEALQKAAAPFEARRQAEAERASIAEQLQGISEEHARIQASTSLLGPSQIPPLGQRERIPTGPRGQFELDLPQPKPEAIKAAAVKRGDEIVEGTIHADAMDELAKRRGESIWYDKSIEHGFTTTTGRFVDREEAFEIAKRNDQMTKSGAEGLPKLHADNLSDVHDKVAADIFKDMPPFPGQSPEAQSIGESMRGRERSRKQEEEAVQPLLQTAKEMNDTLTAPDHQDAIRADIDRAIADRATGSQNAPRATFTTAKGSVYSAFEDGTTTRNKAARSDVGHEGDSGIKDRSAKTIYVDGDASVLSGAGLTGNVSGKGYRVAIKDGKATFLWWNEKEGKWGAPESGRDIPFSTKPEVGKSPVELWKPATDVPGYEAYRGQHAGNKITSVVEHLKPPTEIMVPGIDENGNHTMVGVDKAMDEVDAYKAVAEQIQACANPVQEAAE